MMYRVLAVVFVTAVGLNELFHALSSVPTYGHNVELVHRVMSMETTREPGSWHAIDAYAAAYIGATLILLAHLIGGVLSLFGASQLVCVRHANSEAFHNAKRFAVAGVGVGAVLYLLGFETIASGWFLMWQSETLNVIAEAERLFLSYMAVLLFLLAIRS